MLPTDMAVVCQMERESSLTPWPVSLFQDLIEDAEHTVLVARIGTLLVGYLLYEHKGEIGHITNICVRSDYRRRGLASIMLASVLDSMREEGFVVSELEVRQTNMDAQLFYKKFGFITYEIVAAGYPDTLEDCFLMRLTLAEHSHTTRRDRWKEHSYS
jgi:ribosomal-protein-alanine N-acetyltransferase